MADPEPLKIKDADRLDNGLLVHFSDGLSVMYHTQFLYDVRNQDDNATLPMDEIDDAQEIN